jgi:hypothetical protein
MLKTSTKTPTTPTGPSPTPTTKVSASKAQAQSALQPNPAPAKSSVPPRAATPGSSSAAAAAATPVQHFVDPRPVPGSPPDKNFRANRAQLAPGAWDRIKAHGYGASVLGWMKHEGKTTGKGLLQRTNHLREKLTNTDHHEFKKVQRMLFSVIDGAEEPSLLENGSMRYAYDTAEFDLTWIADGTSTVNDKPKYKIWDARMADPAVRPKAPAAAESVAGPASGDAAEPAVKTIAEQPRTLDKGKGREAERPVQAGAVVRWQPTPTVATREKTFLDFCEDACTVAKGDDIRRRLTAAYEAELARRSADNGDSSALRLAPADAAELHGMRWFLNEVLSNSDWGTAPRRKGDGAMRDSVDGTIKEMTADMHKFQLGVRNLDLAPEVMEFMEKQFQQVVEAGSRLTTTIDAKERAAKFAFIALAGGTLSAFYPVFAGERVGQTVVLASLLKSFYTNYWTPFRETAGGPEATIYAMYRYVGFSFASVMLTPRLIPEPFLDFTRTTGYATTVGLLGAGVQTFYFAGETLAKQVSRIRGKPEFPVLSELHLENAVNANQRETAEMVSKLQDYFSAKAREIDAARRNPELNALGVSPTVVAQLDTLYNKLAETAKQMQVALKGTGNDIEDKDRAGKVAVWVAAMAQLLVPIPFASPTPFTNNYPPFMVMDTLAVAIAVGVQGWSKAVDPSTSQENMMEWFRQMMTFSLAKVLFFAVNGLATNNAVGRSDVALVGWAGLLAFIAMTFGGVIGKGLGAGVEAGVRRAFPKPPVDPNEEAKKLEEQTQALEKLYTSNPAFQTDADLTREVIQHVADRLAAKDAQDAASGGSGSALQIEEGDPSTRT